MAVHKCCTFRLKRKNLLSPTPDACCALSALRSIQLMTGEPRPPVQRAPVTWREWGLCSGSSTQQSWPIGSYVLALSAVFTLYPVAHSEPGSNGWRAGYGVGSITAGRYRDIFHTIGPLLHGLTVIKSRISNYIHYFMQNAISHPYVNFNGGFVIELRSNYHYRHDWQSRSVTNERDWPAPVK